MEEKGSLTFLGIPWGPLAGQRGSAVALGQRVVRLRDQRCRWPPHPWPSAQIQIPVFREVHLLIAVPCLALINLLNLSERSGKPCPILPLRKLGEGVGGGEGTTQAAV